MSQQGDDSMSAFNNFITEISQFNVTQHLETSQQMYAVRQFKVSQLSIAQALEIYQNIYIKFNRNMVPKSELNWWENELRIFVWVLILYVEAKSTKIQQLTENDWEFFSLIFPHKKQILFQYQSINILKEHGQAKKWVPDEDQLFSQLVNDKGLKCKWSELAKLLYIESQKKFFRTPKQCRQRWLNHLDPAKSKSEWSIREDYILIRYVYEKDKRWAEISKLLQNKRNEHSIKNRFKSLITKEQKFHKEKLQETDLVKFIYKRFTCHFTKLTNNHSKETMGFLSPTKAQGEKQQESRNSQENLENFSRISPTIKTEPQRLMFPFAWHPKNKDNQNFVPFRKSHEFLSCNNFSNPKDQDLKESMIGTNFSSMENFPGFFTPQNTQFSLFSKIKSDLSIQKRSSNLEEENQMQKNERNNIFQDMLQENFANEQDLSISHNYERFLPRMMDDYEDQLSLENRIGTQMVFPSDHQMQAEKDDEIDGEERGIRAQIFLTEEPFQLLREFFYQKEIKQKA